MAIDSLQDLSNLTIAELYGVYLAIAKADHRWRSRAMYGEETPPPGHSEFRPLSQSHFAERFAAAANIVGGEATFRARLARQAAAYRVDVQDELMRRRAA